MGKMAPSLSQLYVWHFRENEEAPMPYTVESGKLQHAWNPTTKCEISFYIAKMLAFYGVANASVLLTAVNGETAEYNLRPHAYTLRGDTIAACHTTVLVSKLAEQLPLLAEKCQAMAEHRAEPCVFVQITKQSSTGNIGTVEITQIAEKVRNPRVRGSEVNATKTINMANVAEWELQPCIQHGILFPRTMPGLTFQFNPTPGGGDEGPGGLEVINTGSAAVKFSKDVLAGRNILFFEWLPIIFKDGAAREQYDDYVEYMQSTAHAVSVEAVRSVNRGEGWSETFLNPVGTGLPRGRLAQGGNYQLYDLVSNTAIGKIFRMNALQPEPDPTGSKKVLKTKVPKIVAYDHADSSKATAALFCVEYEYNDGGDFNGTDEIRIGEVRELRWAYEWNDAQTGAAEKKRRKKARQERKREKKKRQKERQREVRLNAAREKKPRPTKPVSTLDLCLATFLDRSLRLA